MSIEASAAELTLVSNRGPELGVPSSALERNDAAFAVRFDSGFHAKSLQPVSWRIMIILVHGHLPIRFWLGCEGSSRRFS
jgi:hypothetical protein